MDLKTPFPEGGLAISAILPAYNEADNLSAVVAELTQALRQVTERFEIIIVDDGSMDGTAKLADELARADARVKVVHHAANQGYGAALRSGFAAATLDWIFFMDADGQFEPAELGQLVARAKDRELVVGYRALRRDPWRRKLYGAMFSANIRLLFGVKARDINCAFKLFQRGLLEGATLSSRGALINAELFIAAKRQGVDPLEIPVTHKPRSNGSATGGSWRVILRAGRELFELWRKERG